MRVQSAISGAVVAITRTIVVAAGAFAPGHLGELTRIVPFELVDCLVDEARVRERRVRDLPSRTGVYFVLAMCLFPRAGYLAVWGKLTAALDSLGPAVPSAKALRDLRRRIGAAPVRALSEVLAGPLGQAPARQASHQQEDHPGHQPAHPSRPRARDTPPEIRDKPRRTLTTRHCG